MSTSVGTMVKQLCGMLGTNDLTPWETGFVEAIRDGTNDGAKTSHLTSKQVEKIEQVWSKHFA